MFLLVCVYFVKLRKLKTEKVSTKNHTDREKNRKLEKNKKDRGGVLLKINMEKLGSLREEKPDMKICFVASSFFFACLVNKTGSFLRQNGSGEYKLIFFQCLFMPFSPKENEFFFQKTFDKVIFFEGVFLFFSDCFLLLFLQSENFLIASSLHQMDLLRGDQVKVEKSGKWQSRKKKKTHKLGENNNHWTGLFQWCSKKM